MGALSLLEPRKWYQIKNKNYFIYAKSEEGGYIGLEGGGNRKRGAAFGLVAQKRVLIQALEDALGELRGYFYKIRVI